MSTPDPCPTGLMERFGAFIARVKQAVADGSGRKKALMGPITVLLCNYLSRLLRRLTAIQSKFVAGTLAPPRPRGGTPCQTTESQASERKSPRIPSGHVFMPFFVAHLHHAMRQLFEDPEMVALIQAAPQAGRMLRPLWRRMTADPLPEILRLPKRSRRLPAAPEPEAAAATGAAPPKPPPKPLRPGPPRPRRRQAIPDEDRPVWVWHPPPLKRV